MHSDSSQFSFSVSLDGPTFLNLLYSHISSQNHARQCGPNDNRVWESSFSILDNENAHNKIGNLTIKVSHDLQLQLPRVGLASNMAFCPAPNHQNQGVSANQNIANQQNIVTPVTLDAHHLNRRNAELNKPFVRFDSVIRNLPDGSRGHPSNSMAPNINTDNDAGRRDSSQSSNVKQLNDDKKSPKFSSASTASASSEPQLRCALCPYKTKSKSLLRCHKRNKHEQRFLHCTLCSYSAKQKPDLRKHYRSRKHNLDSNTTESILSNTNYQGSVGRASAAAAAANSTSELHQMYSLDMQGGGDNHNAYEDVSSISKHFLNLSGCNILENVSTASSMINVDPT